MARNETAYIGTEVIVHAPCDDTTATTLLFDCQWDAILNWLITSKNKTYYEIAVDSTTWGHYMSTDAAGKMANNIVGVAGYGGDKTVALSAYYNYCYRSGYYTTGTHYGEVEERYASNRTYGWSSSNMSDPVERIFLILK